MKLIVSFLGSLKITFYLFIALVLELILGTIVVSGQNNIFYLEYYGNFWGSIILRSGFDNVYNSYICLGLFFLLGLNLLICVLNTSFFGQLLKQKNKWILFCMHTSLLIILIGSLITKFQKVSLIQEVFPQGKFLLGETNTEIKLDDFRIEYYPGTDVPANYISSVVVLEPDKTSFRKDIRVNHPLKIKGYTIYQSSFNVVADLELIISHKNKVIYQGAWCSNKPLVVFNKNNFQFKVKHFLPDAEIGPQGSICLKSNKIKNYALLIEIFQTGQGTNEQWIFKDTGERVIAEQICTDFKFEIKKISCFYSTILEIVKDPGFVYVMVGFAVLTCAMLTYLIKKSFRF
ncbi:MAG: cytochrome c biogenesis protein ResB [Candidatus Omnitrophota bacterium]